ncbi:hypothetical protein [Halapricum hydrolyticum]|uniref:Uncharacterized protein n=1 Tax=Halapricum hydrolyticum TaxID=2979991 RepID=A0AAE3I8N1_9EURY|nr:hypothetical protein [Halapricum hydrolyticum]MCU4717013.1 hypothetical protein [Halapricum hydrolyticum]MCU4725381.1 hypothetical protein [Halapricum hydrolyticum]
MVSAAGSEMNEKLPAPTARSERARLAVDSRADCGGAQFLHTRT